MPLKCYNRQTKEGRPYTTCNKDAQSKSPQNKYPEPITPPSRRHQQNKISEKNLSNNKMPPKLTPSGNIPNSEKGADWTAANKYWQDGQRRLVPQIRDLIPETLSATVFGHTANKSGKGQRPDMLRVRQFKELKAFGSSSNASTKVQSLIKELEDVYNTYITRRKKATQDMKSGSKPLPKVPKPAPKPLEVVKLRQSKIKRKEIGLKRKPKITIDKSKITTKPLPKVSGPKKVSVSYRVGSGPMKTAKGIVGTTSTSRKGVATKIQKPDRRKSAAPKKNAKTAPQKVARFDLTTGRTGNALYDALGTGIGIPRYGNVVTPGQVMLNRNRRK